MVRCRFVALFRAINVGGHHKVAMGDLREMARGLGLEGTCTVLQTGNLIFEAEGSTEALERRIETAATRRFDLKSDVMVRSAEEWQRLIAGNPFDADARADPAHLVLLVLKANAVAGAQAALEGAIKGSEKVRVAGPSAYVVYPDGIGRSKLTPQILELHLGTRATGRNWNTAEKIVSALTS